MVAMQKTIHTDEFPRFVYSKIKDLMIDHNRILPAVQVLKLCRDHTATVRYLYRNIPGEHIEQIADKIDQVVIDHIAMQLREDEEPVVLSDLPRIELEYKLIDPHTILYRINYLDGAFITEWITRKGQHNLHIAVGTAAYKIVKAILDNAHTPSG